MTGSYISPSGNRRPHKAGARESKRGLSSPVCAMYLCTVHKPFFVRYISVRPSASVSSAGERLRVASHPRSTCCFLPRPVRLAINFLDTLANSRFADAALFRTRRPRNSNQTPSTHRPNENENAFRFFGPSRRSCRRPSGATCGCWGVNSSGNISIARASLAACIGMWQFSDPHSFIFAAPDAEYGVAHSISPNFNLTRHRNSIQSMDPQDEDEAKSMCARPFSISFPCTECHGTFTVIRLI